MGKRKDKTGSVKKTEESGRKKWSTKNVLHSPFAPVFPPALAGSSEAVCAIFRREFPDTPMKRPPQAPLYNSGDGSDGSNCREDTDEMQVEAASISVRGDRSDPQRSLMSSSMQLDAGSIPSGVIPGQAGSGAYSAKEAPCEKSGEAASEAHKSSKMLSSEKLPSLPMNVSRNPRKGRPQGLLCGINEVTKGLERDKVALVVVARDVSPSILTAHLPALCFMKDAVLVPMSGSGEDLARILGVKRLLVLGICKDSCNGSVAETQHIRRLYLELKPHACELDFPWLGGSRGIERAPKLPDPKLAPPNKLRT